MLDNSTLIGHSCINIRVLLLIILGSFPITKRIGYRYVGVTLIFIKQDVAYFKFTKRKKTAITGFSFENFIME